MTLDERLTRAAHYVADTVSVPEVDVAAVRRTRVNQRWTVALAAGVAVLSATTITVASRLVDHAAQPAWRPVQSHGRPPADWVGVWVNTLPSGPAAQAAWVDGDTLHVGSRTVRITGRGIGASSGLVVHARTTNGWLASLPTPLDGRLGVIHPDGTFDEFQKYGKAVPLLVSPNGTQALAGADGNGDLIDTATGRIIMHEPAIYAIAWGKDGIYALAGSHGQQPVTWRPGVGMTKSSFNTHRCDSTGTTVASLLAGYRGCTVPGLASISPDGTHALVGNDVVDLATGRRIQFAPQSPFRPYAVVPSYTVIWEDNQHALIELTTPTAGGTAPSSLDTSVIIRCNVDKGSCERASDAFSASEIGLAPLH